MKPKTSSGIITEPNVTEDNKIIATWNRHKEGKFTFNDAFFNLDLLKELKEIDKKNTKDRDRYKGMFKNEN